MQDAPCLQGFGEHEMNPEMEKYDKLVTEIPLPLPPNNENVRHAIFFI